MKIKPLYDRVLISRVAGNEKTAGGLYIPDTAKEKPLEGLVRSAGAGKYSDSGQQIAMQVSEGDRVLFGKYSGTEVNIDGEELLILREDEILAIITE